ncbi:hypothetical protein I3842_16G081600 [Carya illinoinensis]|uniref:Uncharacterized protein n=1 Tax=Carya illinoinensis TaxID=32201 RepID=A0A922A880_CARIL|nr:hypothetical protein I3842_16G081600 [Carya illinoinensis]
MGTCFSCRSSTAFKSIRVVHFSVSQVKGKPLKHFVCTPALLLSVATANASNILKPGTQLISGKLYFLLPYSILQAEISPLDLASIAKRLTMVAKTNRSRRARSWKPILDPIRESSFNRRSESDLKEMYSDIGK